MSITEKEQQTISYYDKKAEEFFSSLGSEDSLSFWANELAIFQEYVPSGNILDIGVGLGREAAVFIKKGYKYAGIEPANGIYKFLKEKFPNQIFFNKTIYDLDEETTKFDGFWCSLMLLHIPPSNIDLALKQIKKLLKPNAVGFISIAEGKGEYFDKETDRYFYLYEQEEFIKILETNGLIVEKKDIRKQETHRIWLHKFLTFFVKVKK